MQIELIGCSSAGKSTLAKGMIRACREEGIDIVLGDEFVLKQVRLDWLKSQLLRALVVNLAALFASVVAWRNNREFYLFSARLLFQLPIPPVERIQLFRNVLKKLGIGEIVRAAGNDQRIYLLDEGMVHVAHNLFVHVSAGPQSNAIATFASLIPLPDVVVYVRQPESTLTARIMERGHHRIPDHSYENVARFTRQAIATFERLIEEPAVASRLLVVDGAQQVTVSAANPDDPTMGLASTITRRALCDQLRDSEPAETLHAA